MAQCPGCGVYAIYPIERGQGYAIIFCPICGPVLIAGLIANVPAEFAHLWRSRGRSAWHLAHFP